MQKDEESPMEIVKRNNNNNTVKTLKDIDDYYDQYLMEDIDFLESSNDEDINTKMNKMIANMKKEGKITYNNNKNKENELIKIEPKQNEKEIINEDKKDETKSSDSYNNKENKKSGNIFNEKNKKILSKQKKLELLKSKEEKYLNIIKLQREKKIKNLENEINKQKDKSINIQKGKSVSETDSNVSYDLEPIIRIENGLAFLCHLFENHIILNKLEFFQLLIIFISKIKKANVTFNLDKVKTFNDFDDIKSLKKDLKKRRQSVMVLNGKKMNKLQKELSLNIYGNNRRRRNAFLPLSKNSKSFLKQLQEDQSQKKIIIIEIDDNEDSFMKLKRVEDINIPIDKSQLVEYDLFYKEQFFTNDVFKYDVNSIEDKEEKEINREMHKLDVKRRLIAKKKEKEVLDLKGSDTNDLDLEIEDLENEYKKVKTLEKPKLDMIMNNTVGLLHKGRMLECYFIGKKEEDFPRFSMESEKEIGAKEVIDFKPLRKEEQARRYFDYCICLKQRKAIHKCLVYTRFWSRFFLDNWIFDNLSFLVILINTIIILESDPTDPNNLGNRADVYFLYFYTLEAVLKIISFTFIIAEDAYLKDYWNILDFTVVIVGWISFGLEKIFKASTLSGLRAFRIMRPLRVLKKIKGLRKLATALLASIVHLSETTLILIFVFVIFTLAGMQLWKGNFFQRCMNINYGYVYSTQGSESMCSFDDDCKELELTSYGIRYVCAKGYINPDSGAISFDNILTGFVTIFVMVSLEGWTNVYTYASKTFKDKVYVNTLIIFLYFHILIFFCAFYLINLFLAVTNSEFEHIEFERKSLIEKKSFYKLIRAKYDLKEKEKISKKEKEKQLREQNRKKSDQSLVDLYYKVKEEAFHIKKNRRTIPILYSTVKDMYILSNDNPEELYLQSLRINDEEKFLSRDISRQQRELNTLIKKKREEMKNNQKEHLDEKNTFLMKLNTQQAKTLTNKNNDNNINIINNKPESKSRNKIFLEDNNKDATYSNLIVKNDTIEQTIENIKKYILKMNDEIVRDSIEKTQRFIKEKTNTITKKIQKIGESDKEKTELRKKLEKKGRKKMERHQIIMEEDLPYEQELKLKQKNLNNKEIFHSSLKCNIFKNIIIEKGKEKEKEKEKNKDIDKKDNNQTRIVDALSFMSDLSLSDMDNKTFKRVASINGDQQDENDLIITDNNNNSMISQKDILKCEAKNIGSEEDLFEEKINFVKPSSLLNSIIKLNNEKDIQIKRKRMQDKFNLNNYLNKEKKKGTNLKNIQRRRSFLKFLKYTQEPKMIDDNIIEDNIENNQNNNSNSFLDLNNDNSFNQESSILSSDSYLSMVEGNLSINDIDLIPQEIEERKVKIINPNESNNYQKLLKSNKIINNMRESIFDRTAINRNVDLTTKEQSKFLKKMNEILNKYLFVNNDEPRGRKNDKLDISHIETEKKYDQVLQDIDKNFKDNVANDIESKNSVGVLKKDSNINIIDAMKFSHGSILHNITRKKISHNSLICKSNKSLNSFIESKSSAYLNIKNSRTRIFDRSKLHSKKTLDNILTEQEKSFYIFKAKSIEKNIDKYPRQNTQDFLIREENKPYKDPLTIQQENIPDNLRGKKYYLNYLFNISDKDLKVKDHFKVDHWSNEILGNKKKFIKKKALPESVEAFFVFNDKKLNLKRYKYFYHKDFEYKDEECSFLSHHLKYLPRCILETMPLRIRNFGKYAVGKEIKFGVLNNKGTLLLNQTNINNASQIKNFNTKSGKTHTNSVRNKSSIIMSSYFANHYKAQEDIKYKRTLFEKAYRKIDELNYRTLSTYFTEEEKFFSKLIDDKKRAEKIRQKEIFNNEKQNRIEVKSEITNIKIYDVKTNSSRYVQWSGPDVLANKNEDEDENRIQWNKLVKSLENFNIIIWSSNTHMKRWQKLRYAFYIIATNIYFDITVLGVVIINSFFMALDGNLLKPETLERMNVSYYVFNSIFILEYCVKFIGLSPLVYYSDPFTYIDTFIIGLAISDYVLIASPEEEDKDGGINYVASKLSFLRVFRIFRLLRLAKLLKRLKSMRLIIVSMTKAIANVSYIVVILIMFIFIFELLGMSLLNINPHYRSFTEGFYITYQVLTLENWDSLLYELWTLNHFSFIYYLIWIFLGNYIIFNLFTSVLLQAFGEDEEDYDLSEDEIIENLYSLPDYLYNLKRAEQEHTKKISNQKRKATLVRELFKADFNDSSNIVIDSTSTLIASQSKDFNKSQIDKLSLKASDANTELDVKCEENDEESSEDFQNRYYSQVVKQMRKWKKINKLFIKNDCENSFYFLSQTNRFRVFCMKLINNKWFERFIIVMIILSTARLILDSFLHGYTLIFDYIDIFFNTVFLIEAFIKICAMGFALDEGSYLSDNWNKLDIVIVICSLSDYTSFFEEIKSSQFLKILRLLRNVRPLRFISHNAKLKVIIMSLVDSILPILNALFIVIVIFYIFSIVGISIFYDNFHSCYIINNGEYSVIDSFEENLEKNKIKNDMSSINYFCYKKYNGIMDTIPTFKFTNIAESLVTSYVLSTQEGWPDIMNSYRVYKDSFSIFFIIYNLVVAYFFLNLFTGIMFKYFNDGFSKETSLAPEDKKAPKYYDFLTQIIRADTHYVTWIRPQKGSFQYYVREFADSIFLDKAIMFCIFLNLIVMGIEFEGCTDTYELILIIANYFFTGIFFAEFVVKILAYNVSGYFDRGWNRFDFFVVFASIVDIIVGNIGIDHYFLQKFQIIKILKVLRVLRILRLVKVVKGLNKIIQTLTWSLPALTDVFILMMLVFGIFAALGCNLYCDIRYEDYKDKLVYINEYYNFDNFYYGFLLIFRCATGENWNNIMIELANIDLKIISESYAYIFMIVSNFVTSIIMLNLFLMVTLQQYDEFINKKYNPIEKFENFLNEFNNSWNKFSSDEDKGFRIKKGLIISFFMDYNWKKLNFPENGKLDYIKKYISDLKLKSDEEDYIYYHDVIFKIIVKQLGSQVDRENPENALILKTEKKVQEKIRKLIERYIGRQNKKDKRKNNITIAYNPLTAQLYYKTSYIYLREFLNNYKENEEFLNHMFEEPFHNYKNSNLIGDTTIGNSVSNVDLLIGKNKINIINNKNN